ncbi:hypothetical protein SSPIM334S_07213 [Streptomyces spiroverticillatus]
MQIVAVKGLGGYQLVCDATDGTAVALLRQRKHRPTKPFAVMVQDIDAARELACVSRTERAALESAVRPVVLLNARASEVAEATHPGTGRIGLFLPTTGLHHLLLREAAGPLVVTSGNLAGGPIVTDDAEARQGAGAGRPTGSSCTTGRSGPGTTTRSSRPPAASCAPCAGRAASPRRRFRCRSPPVPLWWPPGPSSSTPLPSQPDGTPNSRRREVTWRTPTLSTPSPAPTPT